MCYHASSWTDRREQIGTQCLTQEHIDMWTGGAGNQNADPMISGTSTPSPEPLQPRPMSTGYADHMLETCLYFIVLGLLNAVIFSCIC